MIRINIQKNTNVFLDEASNITRKYSVEEMLTPVKHVRSKYDSDTTLERSIFNKDVMMVVDAHIVNFINFFGMSDKACLIRMNNAMHEMYPELRLIDASASDKSGHFKNRLKQIYSAGLLYKIHYFISRGGKEILEEEEEEVGKETITVDEKDNLVNMHGKQWLSKTLKIIFYTANQEAVSIVRNVLPHTQYDIKPRQFELGCDEDKLVGWATSSFVTSVAILHIANNKIGLIDINNNKFKCKKGTVEFNNCFKLEYNDPARKTKVIAVENFFGRRDPGRSTERDWDRFIKKKMEVVKEYLRFRVPVWDKEKDEAAVIVTCRDKEHLQEVSELFINSGLFESEEDKQLLNNLYLTTEQSVRVYDNANKKPDLRNCFYQIYQVPDGKYAGVWAIKFSENLF